jgi:hypothetical protein
MNKKDLALIGGICTIVGAATAASRKRKWEETHRLAACHRRARHSGRTGSLAGLPLRLPKAGAQLPVSAAI